MRKCLLIMVALGLLWGRSLAAEETSEQVGSSDDQPWFVTLRIPSFAYEGGDPFRLTLELAPIAFERGLAPNWGVSLAPWVAFLEDTGFGNSGRHRGLVELGFSNSLKYYLKDRQDLTDLSGWQLSGGYALFFRTTRRDEYPGLRLTQTDPENPVVLHLLFGGGYVALYQPSGFFWGGGLRMVYNSAIEYERAIYPGWWVTLGWKLD